MYVTIDRKPENGSEIQNSCNVQSKMMMQCKIVAHPRVHKHGPRQCVFADSCFASVAILDKLEKED